MQIWWILTFINKVIIIKANSVWIFSYGNAIKDEAESAKYIWKIEFLNCSIKQQKRKINSVAPGYSAGSLIVTDIMMFFKKKIKDHTEPLIKVDLHTWDHLSTVASSLSSHCTTRLATTFQVHLSTRSHQWLTSQQPANMAVFIADLPCFHYVSISLGYWPNLIFFFSICKFKEKLSILFVDGSAYRWI